MFSASSCGHWSDNLEVLDRCTHPSRSVGCWCTLQLHCKVSGYNVLSGGRQLFFDDQCPGFCRCRRSGRCKIPGPGQ